VVLVVSHDRYFLNRVCTDILAFEGDGKIAHSAGDYDYYLEKRQRATAAASERLAVAELRKAPSRVPSVATLKTGKARKLTFKEARELEGMEERIHGVKTEIARIEGLFASPEFHRT